MSKVTLWLLAFISGFSAFIYYSGYSGQAVAQNENPTDALLQLHTDTHVSVVAIAEHLVESRAEVSLEAVMQSTLWQRNGETRLHVGQTQPPKWMRLAINNSLLSTLKVRMDTGQPDLSAIDIWLLRSDPAATEQLVSLRRFDPYTARQVVHRHIAADFELAGSETATLVLRVEHHLPRQLNIRLLGSAAVASMKSREAALSGGFHAVMLCILILTLAGQRIVGFKLAMFFGLYLVSAQLMILGWEQQMFRFVFPNNRAFDLQFWAAMLSLMLAAQLQFGRLLFNLREIAPRYNRVVAAFVLINIIYVILALTSLEASNITLVILDIIRLLSSVALHFVTALLAWRKALYGGRAFLLSSGFIVIAVLLRMFGAIDAESMLQLVMVLFLSESVAFIVALIQRTSGFMRERDNARLAEMNATRRELSTARALNESERAYTKTRQLADQYATRLASVSHDISQPLSALRLALENGNERNPGISESLNYLEQLALGERPKTETSISAPPSRINVRDVTDRVAAMFENEVVVDGPSFEYDPGNCEDDAYAETDGLALMRVLANLLSNAFRHSNATMLTMSLSISSHKLQIDINDNGIGMGETTLSAVMQRHVRASNSKGQGLGLDIVRENCRTQGYKLDISSTLGSGTQTRVTISRSLL